MISATISRIMLALGYRDYRTLWTANVLAGAAAWALIVARGWLAFDVTESSLWVGLVTFMAMAPRFFATPIIGFLADRFDRQTVLAWTFVLNLAHNVALAVLVMMGLAGPWALLALSLLNGTLRASQMTTTQALVPNLVPREHLLNAVALNEVTQQGSRLLGPLAIAPLLAFLDVEAAFWLCSAFYAVGLVQVMRVSTRSRGEIDRTRSFAGNFLAGLTYVYKTPLVLAMVLLAVFHCSLTMSYESLLPVLSERMLVAGPAGVSYLMSAVGAGAVVSSLLLAGLRSEVLRGRLFLLLGVTSGLFYIILGVAARTDVAVAAAVLVGATTAGFMTITHAIIQSIVPDGVRGRVSGIYSMHVGGTMAIANLGNGALSDVFNAPVVMLVTGAAFAVAVLLSVSMAPLRRIYFPEPAQTPAPA